MRKLNPRPIAATETSVRGAALPGMHFSVSSVGPGGSESLPQHVGNGARYSRF